MNALSSFKLAIFSCGSMVFITDAGIYEMCFFREKAKISLLFYRYGWVAKPTKRLDTAVILMFYSNVNSKFYKLLPHTRQLQNKLQIKW